MDFEVNKADLSQTRIVENERTILEEGQVRLGVDNFAFTSNNITYAVAGNPMGYWNFFPSSDPAWGRIPVWGFADVVETKCEGINVGERVFGYIPMSTEFVMTPGHLSPMGFMDVSPHRAAMAPTYNRYQFAQMDPYIREGYNHRALLYPLFFTGFMIDDFLADNDLFGAKTIILASASSKTAIGAAYSFSLREGIEVIGLTSSGNKAFAENLGCYDRVFTYDEISSLPQTVSIYVDMSGDSEVRAKIHNYLESNLVYSMSVGATHWSKMSFEDQHLPGAKPIFFFVPDQIIKRNQDWGPEELAARTLRAWKGFTSWADGWLQYRVFHSGQWHNAYKDVLGGRVDPNEGYIFEVDEGSQKSR